MWVEHGFSTDATVATRFPYLRLTEGNQARLTLVTQATQTASISSVSWNWQTNGSPDMGAGGGGGAGLGLVWQAIPGLWVPPGWRLAIGSLAIQAGDIIGPGMVCYTLFDSAPVRTL